MPTDPIMLLSWLNMKLRDEYGSLEELCRAVNADEGEIIAKMSGIGYSYDEEHHCFR